MHRLTGSLFGHNGPGSLVKVPGLLTLSLGIVEPSFCLQPKGEINIQVRGCEALPLGFDKRFAFLRSQRA